MLSLKTKYSTQFYFHNRIQLLNSNCIVQIPVSTFQGIFIADIGFDTAEIEPPRASWKVSFRGREGVGTQLAVQGGSRAGCSQVRSRVSSNSLRGGLWPSPARETNIARAATRRSHLPSGTHLHRGISWFGRTFEKRQIVAALLKHAVKIERECVRERIVPGLRQVASM